MNEKVQQYLVIFVGVLVIGGVIYLQVRRARPAPPVSATLASTETVTAASALPPAQAAPLPEPMVGGQLIPGPVLEGSPPPPSESVLLQTGAWGRDPFMTLDEIAALVPQPIVFDIVDIPPPALPPPEAPAALPDYRVTVIVSGEKGNWAVIGSRLVRPGDRLGAETIKQINESGVVLELNGKTRELRIDRPGLPEPGGSRRSNE